MSLNIVLLRLYMQYFQRQATSFRLRQRCKKGYKQTDFCVVSWIPSIHKITT